jgi:hypothetical protein
MEIIEAPAAQPSMTDPAFQAFQAGRRAAFDAAVPDANGSATYVNTLGQTIRFVVNDAGSYIADVNGAPPRNFTTRGDIIGSEGNGRALISSPWSAAKVVIDYSAWDNPLRGEIP